MKDLQQTIEACFEGKVDLAEKSAKKAIKETIKLLDHGEIRVCSKTAEGWQVNEWVKKAILLLFKTSKMQVMEAGDLRFVDKLSLKKWKGDEGVRVVPHAVVRKGAFVESGAILMPSYVNIGAYVGSGTMVDTWATVGSCAQIGKNVHLSGGVGIGGVLEPLQAKPVIIEDDVFVGSRSLIVEGAIIEEGAVIGAGTAITASTRVVDVTGNEEQVYKGRVPKNSVVIPGTTSKKFPSGEYQISCALLIGKRSEQTDRKTSLNKVLRDYNIAA